MGCWVTSKRGKERRRSFIFRKTCKSLLFMSAQDRDLQLETTKFIKLRRRVASALESISEIMRSTVLTLREMKKKGQSICALSLPVGLFERALNYEKLPLMIFKWRQ